MSVVIGIKPPPGQRKRVNVFLEGGYVFSLSRDLAYEANLHEGQSLSSQEIEGLESSDKLLQAMNTALKYLAARPRSESEIAARIRSKGFNKDTIHKVLKRLKEQGLIDDSAFATFWRENRETHNQKSRRYIALELRQKGVDAEIISEAIAEVDDQINAYRLARKKARSLSKLDFSDFNKRMGALLQQHGFSYELIHKIIDQVWQEGH